MKPTQPPKYMQPGTRSVAGSGLSVDALGQNADGCNQFMPADVNLHPGGPAEVQYYNGAQPPPAGGAAKKVIKTMPMGGE